MTMKLGENTRGIWYCETLPGEQDFLLTLNQVDEEDFEIIYRFRYYNSDDPFDEKDKKTWYAGKIQGKSEAEVIDSIHNKIMSELTIVSGEFTEILRGDRPFEDFVNEFMEQDFVHARQVH